MPNENIYLNDTFTKVSVTGTIVLTSTFDVVVPTSAATNQSALIAAITPRAASKTLENARVELAMSDLSGDVVIAIAPSAPVAPAAPTDVNPSVTTN